eukprot:TRINITY_DN7446_c0_g1_i2.p1 TRINITY_DN7446_c0_g1~~TRINITY_DN7446_c0_g1_i2.p1  ORF type:complete len:680 (-),score=167.62 TRINITY_DN7446_c0_g1_i2:2-1765(-)
MLLLVLHTTFLVSRTFASIVLANLDGKLVKNIVERDRQQFFRNLSIWLLLAVPATYINSMIKYLESKLATALRTRLTTALYTEYTKNDAYYKVGNLDTRIANVDQVLTEDASRLCTQLAHVYSHISKPLLDIVLMGGQLVVMANSKLGKNTSFAPSLLGIVVAGGTALILKFSSPPFGRYAAEQGRLEGDLRYLHSRVITHSEEIAFYGGHVSQYKALTTAYTKLAKHMNFVYRSRIFYTLWEGFLMKYVWNACGLMMVALPSFGADSEVAVSSTVSDRTQDFITATGLLSKAADAVERILSAYKDVNELAGYTSRITEVFSVFHDVQNGIYQRSLVQSKHDDSITEGQPASKSVKIMNHAPQGHIIRDCDVIELENVPIVCPTGEILVDSISFSVLPGKHILITGPNGCGKSSLFRIIGELWPLYGGILRKPKQQDIFYVPQRPFLTVGTFRDQIIFPDTVEEMKKKSKSDEQLRQLLKATSLEYILERDGGWENTSDWNDVLSGGEKQRVGMARLFYHLPKYAILDECTSAVSIDVEGQLYTHAKALNITLITVSHRPSLWKFHNTLLQFDGQGGYFFKELEMTA